MLGLSARTISTVLSITMSLCTFASFANVDKDRSYILATASSGGTFYPVGVAIATLTKLKVTPQHGMSVSAITSAGSGDNLKLMRNKEAELAILQGLYGAWATQGTGAMAPVGKQGYLRSVTMLWQNVEHFVIAKKYAKTGNVSDLKNLYSQGFGIGKRNSGTEGSGKHIMAALGVDSDKFTLVHKGYAGSSSALQNGQIAGMNIPAGVPVSAITSAYAADANGITVLDFTDEQLNKVNAEVELWSRFEIPANTYPGQTNAIKTIAQPNFLAAHKDMSEEDVYLLTKAIYENLVFLQTIHKATKAMAIEKALMGLPAKLHPGALKYYKEIGIAVPAHLQ
ncbi:C4-dicarboxylate ABC transporter substrate-binding protein [Pseudoalteromonas maricaloris]|uniref:TAXI family TRAP transporter solute-binding subunit n=1 Tax=Pseudoalteromonas maricaloris TaxID=184924 RepID=UPI0021ADA26B|nr:TAXI family TRAP transporter solute-binding subunit [Pseudoalteromonas flavipulchra]USE67789.1 C4-dicarboxylate ABC transporter substrate-binding protein [Pseudoalteromonas flavipulchra]